MTTGRLWDAQEVIRAISGRSAHAQLWVAGGVSIDSRTVTPGDLFIALEGPHTDGHAYVEEALKAGAVAAIVSHIPPALATHKNFILVEDTFRALQDLGRAGRARSDATIIAVTGSVGKTGTKEMLKIALSAVGRTYASQGSYNNKWGVPLSLASLPLNADYGIFELGMNHTGELKELSLLSQPHVAVITNVEPVHLEFFENVAAIADAKAEIFAGLVEDGTVILNRRNKYYTRLSRAARAKGFKKIFSFAHKGRGTMRLIDSALTTEGSAVNALLFDYNIHYSIGAPGFHLVENSLAAVLTAAVVSGKKDECAEALARYKQPDGRGVQTSVALADGGHFTLIDESYNASPPSIRAAISVLSRIIPLSGGRRILVLGDMRELGSTSVKLHLELVKHIQESQIDSVFCCGDMMHYMYDALPIALRGGYAQDSSTLAALVAQEINVNDTVSIKGSKSMRLDVVVNALKARASVPSREIAS